MVSLNVVSLANDLAAWMKGLGLSVTGPSERAFLDSATSFAKPAPIISPQMFSFWPMSLVLAVLRSFFLGRGFDELSLAAGLALPSCNFAFNGIVRSHAPRPCSSSGSLG